MANLEETQFSFIVRAAPRRIEIKPYFVDEPINIQGITGDMLDEPAAALFQHQWQLYRKFVDNNGKKDAQGKTHLDQWSYYKDGFEVYREVA